MLTIEEIRKIGPSTSHINTPSAISKCAAEICERLDKLTEAIETASKVRTLPVSNIEVGA